MTVLRLTLCVITQLTSHSAWAQHQSCKHPAGWEKVKLSYVSPFSSEKLWMTPSSLQSALVPDRCRRFRHSWTKPKRVKVSSLTEISCTPPPPQSVFASSFKMKLRFSSSWSLLSFCPQLFRCVPACQPNSCSCEMRHLFNWFCMNWTPNTD